MSIYATWLLLADDRRGDASAPLVYQGSHINPADDGSRDGWVEVAAIPNHCHPAVRDAASGTLVEETICGHPVEFLRLSLGQGAGTYPDDNPGQATVVLDRSQVEQLHAILATWLDTEDR